LNDGMVCHSLGQEPQMPGKIHPEFMAGNIRKLFSPLEGNKRSFCNAWFKHWNTSKHVWIFRNDCLQQQLHAIVAFEHWLI